MVHAHHEIIHVLGRPQEGAAALFGVNALYLDGIEGAGGSLQLLPANYLVVECPDTFWFRHPEGKGGHACLELAARHHRQAEGINNLAINGISPPGSESLHCGPIEVYLATAADTEAAGL